MLRALIIILIYVASVVEADACDFCACLRSINPFVSESPHIELSLTRQSSSIFLDRTGGATKPSHQLPSPGGSGESYSYSEVRYSGELSGYIPVYDRFAVRGSVPFYDVDTRSGERNLGVSGIGDPSMMLYYVNPAPFGLKRGLVRLGAGGTLPIAPEDLTDSRGDRVDLDLQPGTGSPSVALEGMVSWAGEEWAVALGGVGRFSFENSYGDRRGPSYTLSGSGSYQIYREDYLSTALLGVAGVRFESGGDEVREGIGLDGSNVSTLWARGGLELVFHEYRLQGNVMIPLMQRRAPISPEEDVRLSVGILRTL